MEEVKGKIKGKDMRKRRHDDKDDDYKSGDYKLIFKNTYADKENGQPNYKPMKTEPTFIFDDRVIPTF